MARGAKDGRTVFPNMTDPIPTDLAERLRERERRRDDALAICRAITRTQAGSGQEQEYLDEIRRRFNRTDQPPLPNEIPF